MRLGGEVEAHFGAGFGGRVFGCVEDRALVEVVAGTAEQLAAERSAVLAVSVGLVA
jgi:hypothetical protein